MGSDLGCHRYCAEACSDKDVSDGLISVEVAQSLGVNISGISEVFSTQYSLCKIQGTQAWKCKRSSRSPEENRWRFVWLKFQGELLDSTSITLSLFKDVQTQLSPFS